MSYLCFCGLAGRPQSPNDSFPITTLKTFKPIDVINVRNCFGMLIASICVVGCMLGRDSLTAFNVVGKLRSRLDREVQLEPELGLELELWLDPRVKVLFFQISKERLFPISAHRELEG